MTKGFITFGLTVVLLLVLVLSLVLFIPSLGRSWKLFNFFRDMCMKI